MTNPKMITATEFKSLCRAYTRQAVRTAGSIASSEAMHPMARMKAVEFLMDHGWGKATQLVEHTGNERNKGITEIKLVIIDANQRNTEKVIEHSEQRAIEHSDIVEINQVSELNQVSDSDVETRPIELDPNTQVEHKANALTEHKPND